MATVVGEPEVLGLQDITPPTAKWLSLKKLEVSRDFLVGRVEFRGLHVCHYSTDKPYVGCVSCCSAGTPTAGAMKLLCQSVTAVEKPA